jgi:hypothetical protein
MRLLSPIECTSEVLTSPEPSSENIPATGRVKPNSTVAMAVTIAPPIMNGRRLPNLDFELSASTPVLYKLSGETVERESDNHTNERLNDKTG